jgi:hypothetical protein
VTSLGSIPLIVVSATAPDDQTRRAWTDINGGALSSRRTEFTVSCPEHRTTVSCGRLIMLR